MEDFSTLIGGIAGDGINEAGLTVARLFNRLGYRIYMYYDYPSLIRGGHNFSLVRASKEKIGVHRGTDRCSDRSEPGDSGEAQEAASKRVRLLFTMPIR